MNENKPEAIAITRTFNAPVESLWKMFSVEEEYKKWWGPKGFTCPTAHIDFRVGGKYLSLMKAPDGKEFWSTGTYKEIIPDVRIVCTDSFSDKEGNIIPASTYGMLGDWPEEMLVNINFEEVGGKTKLILTHEGLPEEARKDCEDGWNQSLDKIEEHFA